MSTIFINYRRQDAEGDAGRLHAELTRRLPAVQLFMDVDSIEPGDVFAEVLERALETTDLMLVVMGNSWSGLTDTQGQRRLYDPDDFVRREISRALELRIHIVPVLVQQARLPDESELPEPLRKLCASNAVELRHRRYGDDVKNLSSALVRTLEAKEKKRLEEEKKRKLEEKNKAQYRADPRRRERLAGEKGEPLEPAPTGWSETTTRLLDASLSRDKRGAWRAAIDLLPLLSDIRIPVEPDEARRLLWQAAIQHRWFEIAELLTSALASRFGVSPALKRLHAQMLLERGFEYEALARLDDLRRDASLSDYDRGQLFGHLGRIHKDRFVAATSASDPAAAQHLEQAIEVYLAGYTEDPARHWLGINAAALLAREEASDIRSDAPDEARRLAAEIQADIQKRDPWFEQFYSAATIAEAQLALGDATGATQSLVRFVQHPHINSFALGGTVRQFVDIWQLDKRPEPGPQMVNILRATVMEHSDGAVTMSPGDIRRAREAMAGGRHEAVFGLDRFDSIENYRRGLERSASVARIGRSAETGVGTGFLLPAAALDPRLGDGYVLVTTAHVVSRRPADLAAGAVHPDEAVVTFAALRATDPSTELGIAEVLFESPLEALDVVVARLSVPVTPLEAIPVAKVLPAGTGTQVRVVGHPSGRGLSFSLGEFLGHFAPRLYYRASTQGGSSGSPVFNADWKLIGMHHAGVEAMPKLNGERGTYEANEGISIGAIAQAVAAQRDRN